MSFLELLSVASVLLATLLLAFEFYFRSQPAYKAAQRLPGPTIYPLIGNILEGQGMVDGVTALRYVVKTAGHFKRGYRFMLFNRLHYWPILAQEVEFLFNSSKHSDKSMYYSFMIPMMGEGLLISNGAKWAHRRRILTPAFHFNILQKFMQIFNEESSAFVGRLAADAKNPEGTPITDLISRFTLNNICEETAMGVKLSSTTEPDNYRGMINYASELILLRLLRPLLHSDYLFSWSPTFPKFSDCVRKLHGFSGSVIAQRREALRTSIRSQPKSGENIYEKSRYAMLDTLLEAETEGLIDAIGIQEEVDTFMFEGYDTTSCGLNFCLFTIGTHQEVQRRMYEEIAEIVSTVQGDSHQLGIHDYSRLAYMDQVIKETFRLFPPVPYLSRNLTEPADLGNVTLPADTQVHVYLYVLHRDPAQFPDPERFDPDRFLPENTERRHPFAYIPFSAGTRNCIGQKFAMLEMKMLLTKLLLEYRLETVTKLEDIELDSELVLRTVKPIRVKFIKRD